MAQKETKDYLQRAFNNPKSQSKFALEISGKCVCNCFHCYADILKKYPDMTTIESKQYLHIAKEIGFDKVYIVGGEPMLHPNIIEICKQAKELGFFTILVTNGYRLNQEEIVKRLVPFLDQIEISIRSNDAVIHNRIISGLDVKSQIIPSENLNGGFKKSIDALVSLYNYKNKNNLQYKLIINHDLYSWSKLKQVNVLSSIIERVYKAGAVLDGFYLQIMTIAGRAKNNLEKFEIFKLSKNDLISALNDLRIIQESFSIKDCRLVDDPVSLRIVKNIGEILLEYHKYIVLENVPAICSGGFKPNVHEDLLFEGNI